MKTFHQPGETAEASRSSGNTWYWPVCLLLFFGKPCTALLTHSATSNPVSGPPVILYKIKTRIRKLDAKGLSKVYERGECRTSVLLGEIWFLSLVICSLLPPRSRCTRLRRGERAVFIPGHPAADCEGEGFNWSSSDPPGSEQYWRSTRSHKYFSFKNLSQVDEHLKYGKMR